MINKYQDFIIDKSIVHMISEGLMMASEDFLHKLKQIKKKSGVANVIYDLFKDKEETSNDLAQNWIDVTSEEDVVSFISDVKADRVDDIEENSPFIMKGRSTIKVGRFVRALLKNKDIQCMVDDINFKDKDFEEFVNLYKSTTESKSKKFKLVKGYAISEWYSEEKYADTDQGTLGNSCMKDVNSDYFDLYAENDGVCQLLIYTNNDKELIGRALVWKLEESPCDAKYFMDRAYVKNESDIIKFKNYAENQGWLYKHSMSFDSEKALLFYYKDSPVFGKISVKLKKAVFDKYPFLDTLSFIDRGDKYISNVGFNGGNTLTQTDGGVGKCYSCQGKGSSRGQSTCPECTGLEDAVREMIQDGSFQEYTKAI